MLDGWWTLDDDCKLFWLGRNKHGGKKVSEVHFLTGAVTICTPVLHRRRLV